MHRSIIINETMINVFKHMAETKLCQVAIDDSIEPKCNKTAIAYSIGISPNNLEFYCQNFYLCEHHASMNHFVDSNYWCFGGYLNA